jgi:hypothetical protein
MPSSGASWRTRERIRAAPLDKEEPRTQLLDNSVNRPAADAPKLAYWHHALVATVPATKERR